MTLLERVLDLELMDGTKSELGVWQDLARECGFRVDVITDEEAEYDRVRSAQRTHRHELPIAPTVWIIDRVPLEPRPVSVGGLRAIQPSEGGNLKQWMAARVAYLWRGRAGTLFWYQTKRYRTHVVEVPEIGDVVRRGPNLVRKRQRWETRDNVDLAIGDSPAHLSGFGSAAESDYRDVTAPRETPPRRPPAPRQADLSERW